MIKDLFLLVCSLSWYFTVSLPARNPADGRCYGRLMIYLFFFLEKEATNFSAAYLWLSWTLGTLMSASCLSKSHIISSSILFITFCKRELLFFHLFLWTIFKSNFQYVFSFLCMVVLLEFSSGLPIKVFPALLPLWNVSSEIFYRSKIKTKS